MRRVVRRLYAHLGTIAMEFLWIPRMTQEYFDTHFEVIGLDALMDACGRGQGVLLVASHLGNWELQGAVLSRLGVPLIAVAKRHSNPLVDAWVRERRVRFSAPTLYRHESRQLLPELIGSGKAIALVADQDAGGRGIFVRFFGRPASTNVGPAYLALSTGAPLFASRMTRQRDGRHRLEIIGPIALPSNSAGGEKSAMLLALTQQWSDILEGWVREDPEQWFWVHNRWKTQPRAEPTQSPGPPS